MSAQFTISSAEIKRNKEDSTIAISDLTRRINKAEEDRMEKYYR